MAPLGMKGKFSSWLWNSKTPLKAFQVFFVRDTTSHWPCTGSATDPPSVTLCWRSETSHHRGAKTVSAILSVCVRHPRDVDLDNSS